jgi:hypothetical protein
MELRKIDNVIRSNGPLSIYTLAVSQELFRWASRITYSGIVVAIESDNRNSLNQFFARSQNRLGETEAPLGGITSNFLVCEADFIEAKKELEKVRSQLNEAEKELEENKLKLERRTFELQPEKSWSCMGLIFVLITVCSISVVIAYVFDLALGTHRRSCDWRG